MTELGLAKWPTTEQWAKSQSETPPHFFLSDAKKHFTASVWGEKESDLILSVNMLRQIAAVRGFRDARRTLWLITQLPIVVVSRELCWIGGCGGRLLTAVPGLAECRCGGGGGQRERERENARELFLGDDDEDEDDDDGDDAFFYDDMDCGAQEEKGRRKKERPDQKGSSRLSRICRHF